MNHTKVVAWNTQGYFENEIIRLVNSLKDKPEVVICTEHKQRDLDAMEGSVPGYELAAGYAASSGQRGSAMFIKKGLKYRERPDLDSFSREGVFEAGSIELTDKNTIVTGVYRSPNSSRTSFNDTLDIVANHAKKLGKVHVIAGDLNVDLTAVRSTKDVLQRNNLQYHIRSATHDGGRCLDNFITTRGSGCTGRRLNSRFSDHRPIELTVPDHRYDTTSDSETDDRDETDERDKTDDRYETDDRDETDDSDETDDRDETDYSDDTDDKFL